MSPPCPPAPMSPPAPAASSTSPPRPSASSSPAISTPGPSSPSRRAQIRIEREGKVKKLVPEVDHVSFSGRRAVAQGQEITYVTERCVMKLTPSGVVVTEIAPGIELARDVLAQADFPAAAGQRPEDHARGALPPGADRPRPPAGPAMTARVAKRDRRARRDPHSRPAGEAQRHRRPHDRSPRSLGRGGRGRPDHPRRDPDRGGQGLLGRRRYRGLGRARSHRFRAALDSRGPSRLRPAGPAAPAADRGPQRPCLRRRAGAGGHRRPDHRLGRRAARPAGDGARHDAGLGGDPAPGPPLRQPPGEAHGAGRPDASRPRRRWPAGSSTRWRRRARPWRGPKLWPPTSPPAAPWPCRSSSS